MGQLFRLVFFLLLLQLDWTNAFTDVDYFQYFLRKYGKNYEPDSSEYWRRFNIFRSSLERIRRLSNDSLLTDDAFYGITEFSDLTPDEFKSMHLKLESTSESSSAEKSESVGRQFSTLANGFNGRDLPLRVDWREKGIITPVRNQGKCGACWAYSTVETIEAMNALITGETVRPLSVQQVIDCASSSLSPNRGCDGGDTCSALAWMKKSKVKLVDESKYPLRDDSGQCHVTSPVGVQVQNFTCEDLTGKEERILWKLAHEGPLTAAVDATSWQDYLGGIIQFHCETTRNHAVQIVGYDMTGESDSVCLETTERLLSGETGYYIVKNTWGREFGIDGYLHIAIGKNLCGIAEEVSSVTVS